MPAGGDTRSKSNSILFILTLSFFCMGVIPLLISNWKLISDSRKELESSLQENFVNTATGVSAQVADYVNDYRAQVRDYASKAAERLQKIEQQNESEPPQPMRDTNVLKTRILNAEGKGPYASKLNFQDPNIPNLEFEAFNAALKGKPYLHAPYYDAVDDIPVLLLAEPLVDSRQNTIGVLSVIVSMKPILDVISGQSAGGTRVYLVDSKGNLLLHPKKKEMMARPNLASSAIVKDYLQSAGRLSTVRLYEERQGDNDVQILGSYSSVPGLNWGVIIQIEKRIALASVNAMIRDSTIWGILFAVLASLVGLFLARRITHPIQALAQHALEIGRKQTYDRKIEVTGSTEIQQLSETFNFMTDQVKQHIVSLQTAARENKDLFMSSIRMLAAAIDAKDPYTRGHSERVKDYALIIAKTLGFDALELERLEIAALLHDVGKIGIDDRILRKPTNLTPEEFEIVKTHPDKGANIIAQVAQLADVIPGLRSHHENYDGSGYPQGLKGEEIHLMARVITVADTFDAMTTDRPYQKAFTLEFALNRIRSMQNVKYDPKVVEAFSRMCEEGKVSLHKPSRPRPKSTVA